SASGPAGVAPLRVERRRELVDEPLAPSRVGRRAGPHAADLLDGPLRAPVLWPDDEDHPIHPLKRVLQHEALHLAVLAAAPEGAREKAPTDLEDATLGVVAVVARRADDAAGRPLDRHERAAGVEGVLEELPERRFLTAVRFRMLLPDEGIR